MFALDSTWQFIVLVLLVTHMQERFWNEIEARKEKRRLNASQFSAEQVTINCRACKRLLCSATDMRRRGSNYICVDEDFINSVVVVPLENQEEFRNETLLGKLLL